RVRAHAQVLFGGEVQEGAAPVRHMRDAAAHDVFRWLAVDALTAQRDLALRLDHAADGTQRCRLAGAVRAQDGGDAALAHVEVHAVQHARGAVLRVQVAHLQDGRHCSPPRYALITFSLACTSAGVPSAILRPKSSATTWSDTFITRLMWCST